MIVIDASVIYDSYGDESLQRRIFSCNQPLKAPLLLLQEIWNFKGRIMDEFNITPH